jgi:hypothetical protein
MRDLLEIATGFVAVLWRKRRVVTRLEFVSSGKDNPSLPVAYADRYAQTLWRDK